MRRFVLAIFFTTVSLTCLADDATDKQRLPQETESSKGKVSAEESVKLAVDGQAQTPSIWMQQKLKHSQKIFEAMVLGDAFAVEDAARNLKLINRLESFVKGRHKGYRTQLRAFQFANEEILKGAREKNIDRITLGYNQMTLSCVACHKQLRNGKWKAKRLTTRSH